MVRLLGAGWTADPETAEVFACYCSTANAVDAQSCTMTTIISLLDGAAAPSVHRPRHRSTPVLPRSFLPLPLSPCKRSLADARQ